jgi:hypothetical protein
VNGDAEVEVDKGARAKTYEAGGRLGGKATRCERIRKEEKDVNGEIGEKKNIKEKDKKHYGHFIFFLFTMGSCFYLIFL